MAMTFTLENAPFTQSPLTKRARARKMMVANGERPDEGEGMQWMRIAIGEIRRT